MYSFRLTFIVPLLRNIFGILSKISPLEVFYRVTKLFGKRWDELREYKRVEIYVFIYLGIELLFFGLFFYPPFSSSRVFIGATTFVLCWRLLDIFEKWFNNYILGSGKVLSAPRFIILTLINYLEVTIIFGVIAFVLRDGFGDGLGNPFTSVLQSLRYSVGIMTTMGSVFEPSKWYGYLIFFGEIALGILFLVAIIHIALSFFPKR